LRSVILIVGYLLLIQFVSCDISPGFSDTPSIEFVGISKDTLVQNSLLTDSIFLTISFRDGDGDLGTMGAGITENIIITDSRTDDIYDRFRIPPLDIAGAMTGIEGTITMKVYTTCCQFPEEEMIIPCEAPSQFPTNELTLFIKLIDDSGKESNPVASSPITLLCN